MSTIDVLAAESTYRNVPINAQSPIIQRSFLQPKTRCLFPDVCVDLLHISFCKQTAFC